MKEDNIVKMEQYMAGLLNEEEQISFKNDLLNIPAFSEEWDDYLIECYLDKNLPESFKDQLETRLAQEPELQDKLDLQQQLHDDISLVENEVIKKELQQIIPQKPISLATKLPLSFWKKYQTWAAAAIILLGIAVATWMYSSNGNQSERIFADSFQAPTLFLAQRGQIDRLEQEAIIAYEEQRFARAYQQFRLLYLNHNTNEDYAFYMGVSALASDFLPESIEVLSTLQNSSQYGLQARWYAALAHIKSKQWQEAKDLLSSIIERNGSPFEDQAKNLLEKLSD